MAEQKARHVIPKKHLYRAAFNWETWVQCCYNYERMMGMACGHTFVPVIDDLYKDDPDGAAKRKEVMEREMEFFNVHIEFGSCILGMAIALEEQKSLGEPIPGEFITSLKTSLMGPLAGLGDSLLNGTARPILAGIAISLITAGLGWIGPIFFVIGMSIVSLGVRYLGVFQGYKQGVKFVEKIQSSGLISRISELAAIAAYVIVGGFIPALVVISIPIVYQSGDTVLSIQETLDGLMPGILGMLYTGLMYLLISKKKISAVKLILVTMIVGIVGTYCGILG